MSYIAPAPTWRVSYRLVTGEQRRTRTARALLLGWGIFDNRLEEDLEGISLSLVAGCPSPSSTICTRPSRRSARWSRRRPAWPRRRSSLPRPRLLSTCAAPGLGAGMDHGGDDAPTAPRLLPPRWQGHQPRGAGRGRAGQRPAARRWASCSSTSLARR